MILIEFVRIAGFRGLKNLEVKLTNMTILTGMNNSGKTSFLKAIQLALGNRNFITQDDFFIENNVVSKKIIIDLKIVQSNEEGKTKENFDDKWEKLFTVERIRNDGKNDYVPLRTVIELNEIKNIYTLKHFILLDWVKYKDDHGKFWNEDERKVPEKTFNYDEIPFFYVEAQRDILEDIKIKNSYIGKMLSKLEYSEEVIKKLESEIEMLNMSVVSSSEILQNLKENLKGLDATMNSNGAGIDLSPFTKKIRDLNKGFSIYYGEAEESFSMEYHGMGTRSWTSLLTLKSFVGYSNKLKEELRQAFFPIIALEEPESHLHPNAQKILYKQIKEMRGQKIISTHSPYILERAQISEIVSFYKKENEVSLKKINLEEFTKEDLRKISRTVIKSRGELFFAKIIILVEGESEEQILQDFADKYFKMETIHLGIEFVKVNSFTGYAVFIKFAEVFGIPWIIFSDNDQNSAVKISVEKQANDNSKEKNNIIFLDDGNDLEAEIVKNGYQEEVKKYLLSICEYTSEKHKDAKEPENIKKYSNMTDQELIIELRGQKTRWSSVIAKIICEEEKDLPPRVIELFEKVKEKLSI